MLSSQGRLYHKGPAKAGGKALIQTHLAARLFENVVSDEAATPDSSGYAMQWQGQSYPILSAEAAMQRQQHRH